MDYIILTKQGFNKMQVSVKTDNIFFDKDMVLTVNDSFISFSPANLDRRGKTHKFTKNRKHVNYYQSSLQLDLKEGKFFFNVEESNEDFLIAYFD